MVKCHFLRLGTVIPMTIYPPVYDGIIINLPCSRFSSMYFLGEKKKKKFEKELKRRSNQISNNKMIKPTNNYIIMMFISVKIRIRISKK